MVNIREVPLLKRTLRGLETSGNATKNPKR
jgi:hypothetical protein